MRLIDADALMERLGITSTRCDDCALADEAGFCSRGQEFADICYEICEAPEV